MSSFSRIDTTATPPEVSFDRAYNAAVDIVERHGRGALAEKTCLIDDAGAHSYADLGRAMNRAGDMLGGLGMAAEQRVVMCITDGLDFAAVFFGAIKAGFVAVPVNTMLTSDDYDYILRDSRAPVLVVSRAPLDRFEPLFESLPHLRHVVVAGGGPQGAHEDLAGLLAVASDELAAAETSADDVAFWLYSSGSTGRPKGAAHLQSDMLYTIAYYGLAVLGLREDDVVYSAAKMFFAYGLGNSLSIPLYAGATAVVTAGRPTPEAVVDVMHRHQPTVFFGVPTLYGAILADQALDRSLASDRLRLCVSAGEALPKHIGETWETRFGAAILDGIGSTEMLHIFISNRPGDNRYGSTGKPIPGYDLRLLDEAGEAVADGEVGELWVGGPSASPYYWNNRAKSLDTFHGPWTRTGDKYVGDRDGYYIYAGRSDDMLKVGGIWVSPFEVESALLADDEVLEVAVVGREDADRLVKPMAYVVLKEGHRGSDGKAEALKAFVKDRIAPYKYPRWIEFADALPKTATGKIQRFKLRD